MSRSLIASFLFMTLVACAEPLPSNVDNSDRSDELSSTKDGTFSLYILYDYAYLEVSFEGDEGPIKLTNSALTGQCTDPIVLASGLTSEPLTAVAWKGLHYLNLEAESSKMTVTQRPIPGCGSDKGTIEPTAADLRACTSVMELIAKADTSSSACYSG